MPRQQTAQSRLATAACLALLPWAALPPGRPTLPAEASPADGAGIGNVYLEGQAVVARFPAPLPSEAVSWRALDDRGREVARGELPDPPEGGSRLVRVGTLGIGWYRVEALTRDGVRAAWTTACVLAPLCAKAPADSPVAVDSATAWFAPDDPEVQREYAHLASLAGVRWVRDRLRWRDLEPAEGTFAPPGTTYDSSARIQSELGLSVLQVFHDTPPWAADAELDGRRASGRFARDLRHAYRLARSVAERFRGKVVAWEPWNEANIENFGGHTVDAMCSWQKASWLGFKSVDPELTVGWNAYAAVPTRLHADGVILNEAWPYFDTYNLHSYDWPESYADLWSEARRAACGKPIWVTEADRGFRYEGEKPWCELSPEGEIRKAEYMAHAYASSLFSGARVHFHFILGHYTEDSNGVQFGLLRLDRTPRPAYVALAAVGRFLAGATPLGRWRPQNPPDPPAAPDLQSPPDRQGSPDSTGAAPRPAVRVYAFRGLPDGRERDVLVAWCESPGEWSDRGKARSAWSLPKDIDPEECFDYLGRSLGRSVPATLTDAATFVILPPGSAGALSLEQPPELAPRRGGRPSPIVLQLQLPRSAERRVQAGRWSQGYEYSVEAAKGTDLPLHVYNFASRTATGVVQIDGLPAGAGMEPARWEVTVEPMGRCRIVGTYRLPDSSDEHTDDCWIRLRGEFGDLGRPALAFRLAVR